MSDYRVFEDALNDSQMCFMENHIVNGNDFSGHFKYFLNDFRDKLHLTIQEEHNGGPYDRHHFLIDVYYSSTQTPTDTFPRPLRMRSNGCVQSLER